MVTGRRQDGGCWVHVLGRKPQKVLPVTTEKSAYLKLTQHTAKLEEQNKELWAKVSSLTKKLGHNKSNKVIERQTVQPDKIYHELQDLQSGTEGCDVSINDTVWLIDKTVSVVEVCGANAQGFYTRRPDQTRGDWKCSLWGSRETSSEFAISMCKLF